MATVNDFNRTVIEEFRANDGKVSGQFAGAPLLLLSTTGAKSGQTRTNPVAYRREGERVFVFASKAGSPQNPDWYHNLVAHPEVTVELAGETYRARAVVIDGAERERVWEAQKTAMPGFADYERKTERRIPVVELQRAS